jgi:zinc/manganese transport system substrate-binding protein
MLRTSAVLITVAAIALGACSSADSDGGRPLVVATTNVLGDVAGNVAGGRADVEVLMPTGTSPHEFVPSSRQVAMIYKADLVVANGLGLEGGLADVLGAAMDDGVNVLEVAPHLEPIPLADGDELDPHVWMDPIRMKDAADAIAGRLFRIDGNEAWQAHADAYSAELDLADRRIESLLAPVAAERRTLVTNHDSLGYFADRYGFAIIGTVIPGSTSIGDPSSAELAELVATIKGEQVPAIFIESSEPQALAEVVAAEAGSAVVIVELFTGSLAEKGRPGDTLIGMLIVDAERIAAALGP